MRNNLLNFLAELEDVSKRCFRKRQEVQVVYATKYLNPEQLADFISIAKERQIAPLLIGENRVQEAGEKREYLKTKSPKLLKLFKMIMIGTLQKNKINKAIEIFEEIHSVDSLELAKAIDMRLQRVKYPGVKHPGGVPQAQHHSRGGGYPVFLEVNVSGEESKHGIKSAMIDNIIKSVKSLKFLKLEGLMTMAPHFDNPENARPIFRTLRQLANRYHLLTSMGMSNDWVAAIKEGSDIIRIGSRIFLPANKQIQSR